MVSFWFHIGYFMTLNGIILEKRYHQDSDQNQKGVKMVPTQTKNLGHT